MASPFQTESDSGISPELPGMSSNGHPEAEASTASGIGYDAGSVVWHCTEEDGGPDVGVQLGLGLGFSLYCGELSTSTLEDHGVDLKTYPDGWWIVLYGPKDQWIIGAVPDTYRAQEAIEHISGLLERLAEAAKAEGRSNG